MLSMPRIVRPDPFRFRRTKFGSPGEPATRRLIKRNKELPEASGRNFAQSNMGSPSTVKRNKTAAPEEKPPFDEP
jgi:hypothetical protein